MFQLYEDLKRADHYRKMINGEFIDVVIFTFPLCSRPYVKSKTGMSIFLTPYRD